MNNMNDVNNDNNQCAICLETINPDDSSQSYKIDCNHEFHTDCIMKWFRLGNSNCPLCNDSPNINTSFYTYTSYGTSTYIDERYKVIKRISRKKDAPEALKKHIDKLKSLELELKEADKTRIEYLKKPEVKEYKKTLAENNRRKWKKRNSVHKQKIKIVSLYPQLQIFQSQGVPQTFPITHIN